MQRLDQSAASSIASAIVAHPGDRRGEADRRRTPQDQKAIKTPLAEGLLNNNWESLVRRGRGYRNHDHLLLKLRFMTANPIRSDDGIKRFLALGLQPPPSL